MLKTFTLITAGAALLATGLWAQEETPDHRMRSAASVLHEMLSAPDHGIPRDLLEKSMCVIVVPLSDSGASTLSASRSSIPFR